jgi:hypothetical protein
MFFSPLRHNKGLHYAKLELIMHKVHNLNSSVAIRRTFSGNNPKRGRSDTIRFLLAAEDAVEDGVDLDVSTHLPWVAAASRTCASLPR